MRSTNFTDEAWDDYLYGQGQDKKTLKRINQLVESARRTPFEGIGKPEPLKGNLTGFWSRRIDEANRLVYAVNDTEIIIVSCRYHYQ
jgi:toxin YoeB